MATAGVQLRPRPTANNIDPTRRHTTVVGLKTSKFRHISVTSGGKEGTFINLRQINTRLRPESNGFCISNRWAAVPLSAAGGVIAVFDLHKPTKIADGVIPGLENGANVADFAFSPFNENSVVVACDNGMVNFWDIPAEGIYGSRTTPTKSFKAHSDKINVVKFNPVAQDVLATAANNGEITIWDTGSLLPKIQLEILPNPVLAMTWSSDGNFLAVITRDCYLRVFEPRTSTAAIMETVALETPKGSRVLFVCNDKFILISSLTKSSQRKISLYSAKTLSHVHSLPLDSSSSLLIPHYDFDSSIVFLTGKGDRTIQMFEICDESPYFLQLSPFSALTSHQAIAFTQKNAVDVRKVEIARGARLLLSELENTSFKVPRIKMDYFQNDLFPPALVTWESVVNADQWFRGTTVSLVFDDLNPVDMKPLYAEMVSLARVRAPALAETPLLTKLVPIPDNLHENETNGISNGKVDECKQSVLSQKSNGAISPAISTIRKMSDGFEFYSPPENGVSQTVVKSQAQQRKRLSIDPNSQTPFRDLLRRCDEMPGVVASRQDSDGCETEVSYVTACMETPRHDDDEWK